MLDVQVEPVEKVEEIVSVVPEVPVADEELDQLLVACVLPEVLDPVEFVLFIVWVGTLDDVALKMFVASDQAINDEIVGCDEPVAAAIAKCLPAVWLVAVLRIVDPSRLVASKE